VRETLGDLLPEFSKILGGFFFVDEILLFFCLLL